MAKNLRRELEKIYALYNRREYVSPDPLELLYRYKSVRDREIAGLAASCFAYGNVRQIVRAGACALAVMGDSPRRYLEKTSPSALRRDFSGFRYRFTRGEELSALLGAAKTIIKEYGWLGGCAAREMQRGFAARLRGAARGPVDTLIPSPGKGSALKRLNLFFRWMCRRDEVDPGGWDIAPSALIVPLDTHMNKIGRALGFTARAGAGMKTALEITAGFAALSPDDPVKYDFCLTRFGIRDGLDMEDLKRRLA
ncbi:MAG: TIGR02757 family protein [Elusimicrobiales bacterium]